jgi:hypothetical protein
VKHVLVTLIVAPLVATGFLAILNWLFRRRGSSFSAVASVISQWLVMALIWTFLGHLLQTYAAIEEPARTVYTRSPLAFGLFAVILGTWQYRLARAREPARAARVFRWSQITWLVLMLVDRGVFR